SLADGLRPLDEEPAREFAVTASEQFGGALDPLRIRRGDDVWKFHGTRVLDPCQLECEVEQWPPIGVRVSDRHHTPRTDQRPRTGSSGPLAVTEVTGQSRRDRMSGMTLLRRRRSSLR